jgi:hypothetical protein
MAAMLVLASCVTACSRLVTSINEGGWADSDCTRAVNFISIATNCLMSTGPKTFASLPCNTVIDRSHPGKYYA